MDIRIRNYFLANLLALPGIGTIAAGRRVAGCFQAILAAVGMAFSLLWVKSFAAEWYTNGFPADGGRMFKYGLLGAHVSSVGV